MKERLAIIGSGDLGQLIAWHARNDNHYDVVGFFDDYKDEKIDDYPVLGKTCDVVSLFSKGLFDCLLIAVGYKHMNFREKLFDTFKDKIPFGKIIHSSCIVDTSCKIHEGCVLLPGCVLDRNVRIERNVLLNTGVTIAHDTVILPHSFLAPRVSVAGFTQIGRKCIIGINSTIIDNIVITDNVQLGGATVVIDNIEKSGLWVGNPARFVR
jgi:sugar O-acyltransferase (sialic acid O-acetyltransferase NeuD family)